MQNDRFLSSLGMARKANKVSLGYDKALEAIHKGVSQAVFVACDISEKTKRGIEIAAEYDDVQVITVDYDIFAITNAIGTKTGIVSINDSGFAKKLISLI